MVGRADEFRFGTRVVGNDRKVAIRDDNFGTGRRASQFGSSRREVRKTKEGKARRKPDLDDESSDSRTSSSSEGAVNVEEEGFSDGADRKNTGKR